MNSRSFILIWTLIVQVFGNAAKESAWNGHVTAGSDIPGRFLPYYVPPGAKSYDSSSPLIQYSGKWIDSFSPAYVHRTLRWTDEVGSSASFAFYGTGIELFGNMDRSHGISDVFVDGTKVKTVDSWSDFAMQQQRIFWNYNLPHGKHVIKVVNTGQGRVISGKPVTDIDAFVVTKGPGANLQTRDVAPLDVVAQPQISSLSSEWTLVQQGVTGVAAMQIGIISPTHAIIIDKVEHNPLTINGHPAWAALYNLKTHAVKPLTMQSNSFCAGGTFLSNGTFINVGGNPVVGHHTSSADFGALDGLQAVRIFEPCLSENVDDCDLYENHSRLRMASPRWYPTVVRISDGSAMIIGGSKKGGWINNATVNNPTIEYWPPKSIHSSNGLPIHLPFLVDTLNSNLFPIAFALPDGRMFIAANRDAMLYDWLRNKEQRLPRIPNGVRVTYPMAGTGLLLPLSPERNYTAEILLCGGSTISDTMPGYEISSQDPASSQCSRILLTEEGIVKGWEVEKMPQARMMADAILLPTGDVVIINGAGSGISGYGNVKHQVGQSNADHPVLMPVLYRPAAPAGQRFLSQGMKNTSIPRLYHSVATLTPNGDIMVAGSNPNLDRSEIKYGTEYRVEWVGPPYMKMNRPVITQAPRQIIFGEAVKFTIDLPTSSIQNSDVKVVLMDLGFVTHTVHANSRMVYLVSSVLDDGHTIEVWSPPNANIYPPGPGWIYIVVDGVPSIGSEVMIGDGKGPKVDQKALDNLLRKTKVDQYEASKKSKKVKKPSN